MSAARFSLEHEAQARRYAEALRAAGYDVEGPTLTNDRHGWRVEYDVDLEDPWPFWEEEK